MPASYTITVQNTGTTATTAVATISDTINAGITLGAMPAGCGAAGQVVTCTIAAGLAPAASVSFVIPVTPTISAVNGDNTATVSGGGDPTCPADARCDDTVLVPLVAPQLTLTKTASATPWTVGVPASYTITVQNTGTTATTAVATISDTINAGITLGAMPAGCGAAGQVVTCTIAAGLAPAASVSFVIPVTPTISAVNGDNTATVVAAATRPARRMRAAMTPCWCRWSRRN
ncbi:MAG: hypothetical protein IPH76_16330 [Xanthomonadales bacterium]|nr:hypothetical protein [Xanthomonadales bacterium]